MQKDYQYLARVFLLAAGVALIPATMPAQTAQDSGRNAPHAAQSTQPNGGATGHNGNGSTGPAVGTDNGGTAGATNGGTTGTAQGNTPGQTNGTAAGPGKGVTANSTTGGSGGSGYGLWGLLGLFGFFRPRGTGQTLRFADRHSPRRQIDLPARELERCKMRTAAAILNQGSRSFRRSSRFLRLIG